MWRSGVFGARASEGEARQGEMGSEDRAVHPQVQPESRRPEELPEELRGGQRGGDPRGRHQTEVGFRGSFLFRRNCGLNYR